MADSEPKDQKHGEFVCRPLPPAVRPMLREKGTAATMRPHYASPLASFTRPGLRRPWAFDTEKLLLRATSQTVVSTASQAKMNTLHAALRPAAP
ncbi:hypothetical protein [Streptomyces sp. BA2]|uniref:hypothetical protein n=1 Tax=Streptomyces sp. BA2 TaxID=436595 RepID=UPI001321FF48|nr:hypothetical protein [Streptomyces sp. BA2]MWA08107.1 hypothetical protein [Streptomyces sp. BA2]